MAELTYPQIQDTLIGESQHLAALVAAIQDKKTAQDARHLAECIETIAEGLYDCTHMIDDIIHGRKDEYGIYEDDDDESDTLEPSEPPKFAPAWALVKRCEDSTAEPIPLSDDDLFVGCCPKCGKPATLTACEFYDIIGNGDYDGLDTGVHCGDCSGKSEDNAGTTD